MRPSEAFQLAIDQKVPQIKGAWKDGKGGYCAKGWLYNLDVDPAQLSRLLIADSKLENYGGMVVRNDLEDWTWEMFRNYAKEHGL